MHDAENNRDGLRYRRLLRTFIASALWVYAAIAAFLWYGAYLVPEGVVGVRILAGAVSDQVWMPLGMIVWFLAIDWVWSIRKSSSRRSWRRCVLVLLCSIVGVVFFPDFAFRMLFIPMLILVVRAVIRMRLFREGVRALSTGLPFWTLIVLICLYYNWLLLPVHPAPIPSSDDTTELTVLTYNIYRRARVDRRQQVIDTIRKADADIVCMVEVLFDHDEALFFEELGDRYPYMMTNQSLSGVRTNSMVLSKYPIRAERPEFEDWSYGQLDFTFYTATVNGMDIRIVSFHLQTVGHYFENLHRREGAIPDRLVESNEQEGHIDRTKYAQVSRVCEYLATDGGPVILLGDMNDTANGRVYRLFRKSFVDTYAETGWGLGTTFGRTWLLNKRWFREIPLSRLFARDFIRIDYILTSNGVQPRSAGVIKSAQGSDHRPVFAIVELPEADALLQE